MRLPPTPFPSHAPRRSHNGVGLAGSLVIALLLGGCMTDRETTGSIPLASAAPRGPGDADARASELGARYQRNPGDRRTALDYARALRAADRTAQAVAVLENAAIKNPYDREILSAYGKALADVGRLREAAEVLPRAHTPDNPDWSVLSAQGSVADQLGDHAKAQSYYDAALKIVPNNPNVMSNLGLSYALSRRLPEAEQMLRRAAAQPGADMRVRQNLALVLGLEGRYAEAEEVARRDLSPQDAAESVAAIRAMGGNPGAPRGRKVATSG